MLHKNPNSYDLSGVCVHPAKSDSHTVPCSEYQDGSNKQLTVMVSMVVIPKVYPEKVDNMDGHIVI